MDLFSLDTTHLISDLKEVRALEGFLILDVCNLSLHHHWSILITPHVQRLALLPSACLPVCILYDGQKGKYWYFSNIKDRLLGNMSDYCPSMMNPEEVSHEQSLEKGAYNVAILKHQN